MQRLDKDGRNPSAAPKRQAEADSAYSWGWACLAQVEAPQNHEGDKIMRRSFLFGMMFLLGLIVLTACGTASTPILTLTSVPPTAVPPSPMPEVIPSSTPIPLPTSTTAPSLSELRSTIVAAVSALKDKSHRQSSETVLSDGNSHHTVVEYVVPDRYHIVADLTTEIVIVEQKVYIKQNEDGVWRESQIPVTSFIDPDFAKRLEESIADIRFIGADSLDGKPMWVYQYRSKTKIGEAESTLQTKLWIGETDTLPYKMAVDGETAAIDLSTGKVTSVKSIETILFEYDSTIKIDAPIK